MTHISQSNQRAFTYANRLWPGLISKANSCGLCDPKGWGWYGFLATAKNRQCGWFMAGWIASPSVRHWFWVPLCWFST